MRTLIVVWFFCIVFMFWLVFNFIKYRNPYKLYMVFGKKGSGKTTLMTKLALKYSKPASWFNKRWYTSRPVFCNTLIPGTYYFNIEDIGLADFPPNSVILIDEVGMIWDNRDFKNFKNHVRDYFKLQRHYRHTVYLFSQSFDIDKKLRDLTDHMYLIMGFFNFLSVARRITKTITITHGDTNATGESKLIDDLRFDSLLLFWCGSIQFTYIPKYVKYFKSFEAPKLQPRNYEYIPLPKIVRKRDRFFIGLKNKLALLSWSIRKRLKR